MNDIYFFSVTDEYGEFSNFSLHQIKLEKLTWPTVEHYFQASKFTDEKYKNTIRNAATPLLAARLGRSRKVKIRKDWESAKIGVMRDAVRAKFQQHPDLLEMLLATGSARIFEDSPTDSYWGIGANRNGKNMLGNIIMEIRAEFVNSMQEQ
ncbi:NADAR family protein [Uliginosibacterium gangwonense]|uniref:NADAR family protein n=1 Tax=Uliginosibacterium gangwonense TaxID=392736 RepID=UPI0003688CDA|nr:NADAR family protein [Uliginosibacterium gangwonense]